LLTCSLNNLLIAPHIKCIFQVTRVSYCQRGLPDCLPLSSTISVSAAKKKKILTSRFGGFKLNSTPRSYTWHRFGGRSCPQHVLFSTRKICPISSHSFSPTMNATMILLSPTPGTRPRRKWWCVPTALFRSRRLLAGTTTISNNHHHFLSKAQRIN
jgi:hypothetical protein